MKLRERKIGEEKNEGKIMKEERKIDEREKKRKGIAE